jgi:hypothetical protein
MRTVRRLPIATATIIARADIGVTCQRGAAPQKSLLRAHNWRLTMAITFLRLQEYLNKIAAKGNLDPANSGHGVFWNIPYQAFMSGMVPNKHCGGHPVPIVDPNNKVNSALNPQGGLVHRARHAADAKDRSICDRCRLLNNS